MGEDPGLAAHGYSGGGHFQYKESRARAKPLRGKSRYEG
jgi:hypothetical protein